MKLAELDRLAGSEIAKPPRPGGSPQRLAQFEARIGFSLPEDYREFLLLHDGWPGFNGDTALLSIEEMSSGPLFDHLQLFQTELRKAGRSGPGTGLIIEGSFGTRISYFDRENAHATGKLDVVFWDGRELERHPSFVEYLEGYNSMLDTMIEQERANFR
jgi:cell wall assembly regulator SMI1